MSDDDRYIPGVPCWVDIGQPDPAATAAFYGGLFGWTFEEVAPAGAPEPYTIAHLPGGTVAGIGGPGTNGDRPTWETYIRVADVTETTAQVRAAGGRVLVEPTLVGPPGRMATFADPGGAVFSVWQAGRRHGADVVNEHGAVNFNQLHTRDVARAEAFYGSVFGWELIGVGDASMWALPAYGDFLEERRPGTRQQTAEFGAPARFEEVVASLIRTGEDDDAPDHWSVVFGIDDADAAAARAKELGGTVLVEPVDAPWVRMTVIRDPQGATFIANKFVPENRDLGAA
jgi:uncharacterized protein